MSYKDLPIGQNIPEDVNVIIENPVGGEPVKYEMDKETGMMFVDRFLHTVMYYPGNYGFIPHTLSDDGDPVDVLVLGKTKVMPGAVMRSRPVGVLIMEDESGMDEKILAVPCDELFPYHDNVRDIDQVRPILKDQIEHFFTHYKDLEKGKWSKTVRWGNAEEAKKLIIEGVERAKDAK
ncbi:MAG: inorganic diphosphatase [Micavibrio sp.]|nr:inorganic diphosphatase [Micavibrio sp.]|tara:strand:+ start:2131 stop:2664 length:534 start_codon:yes stop_codon:yes gene_type:complete